MIINKKGYTLIELLIVIVIISILGTITQQYYTGYIKDSINQKRENIVRIYGILFNQIVKEKGDIPKGYCTNNGISYDDNSCFNTNGCSEIECNINNLFCSNGNNGYFYDIKKLIKDNHYEINKDYLISGENYPNGFNYKICKIGGDQAFIINNITKESGVSTSEETYSNPSYIFKIKDYTTNMNKEIYKYINYF